MPQTYVTSVILVALFTAIGVGLPLVALTLSRLLRPHRAYREKGEPYESGNLNVSTSWVRFHVKYYLFALLFVIFDVETLFLYPWAVAYDALGTFALAEMGIFLFILVFGLYYAWRQEVLEWN